MREWDFTEKQIIKLADGTKVEVEAHENARPYQNYRDETVICFKCKPLPAPNPMPRIQLGDALYFGEGFSDYVTATGETVNDLEAKYFTMFGHINAVLISGIKSIFRDGHRIWGKQK